MANKPQANLKFIKGYGKNFKELRERKGLTQKQLYEEIHISDKSISLIEKEQRKPTIEQINIYSEYFGASLDFLTGRTNIANSTTQMVSEYIGLSKEAIEALQEMNRKPDIEEDEINRILDKQKRYSEAIHRHPQDYLSAFMLEEVNEMPCPLSRDEEKAFHVIMQHITNTQVLEMINDILSIWTEKEGETYGTELFKQIYNYCRKEFMPINYEQQDEGGVYLKEMTVDTQKNAILLEISRIVQEFSDKIKEREKHG